MAPAAEKARSITPFFSSIDKMLGDLTKEIPPESKIITLVVTTMKGLCGATNNNLMRTLLKQNLENHKFIIWGDKGCGALENSRLYKNQVLFSAHPNSKHTAAFQEIGTFVDQVMKQDYDYIRLYFNAMESKGFQASIQQIWIPSYAKIREEKAVQYMNKFTLDSQYSDEMLLGLHEYHITSAMNYAVYQNQAVEMFNRRNSMENASKNAKELVRKLTLLYNRGRQTSITTELCEITAGKAALEEN
jgi:ATP synthase F1 gamma subunit